MTYRLSDVYTAIADPHRRDIMDLLRDEELNVAQVADHFDMTRTAVDKHLKVLVDANLVIAKKVGRTRIHRLNPAPMKDVWDWMAPYAVFWSDRLQRLKDAVEQEKKGGKNSE